MLLGLIKPKTHLNSNSRFYLFLFILFVKALVLLLIILYAGIGLGPDEAQYWTWSQALDWGYYSKPPGIAWQIWLGTQWFGQSEVGVRSLSILLAIVQACLVYQLALSSGLLSRAAFWCGLSMALSPLGIAGSFFAITDIGFLLCWTGASLIMVSALQQKQEPHPLKIGGWIMVGALFKWPIYLFWLFVMCCRHWYFPTQKKRNLLGGILLSLAGLLPSVWWNWSHDWATFRHVFATLQGGSGHRASGNAGEFLGSQALLISPILFILFVWAFWDWFRQRQRLSPPLFFCGFVTFVSLGLITVASFFQKVQGNWITFAYPTGFVIFAWNVFQEHPKRVLWAKIGIGFSLLLTFLIFFLPFFYSIPGLTSYAPSYRMNPFKHNLGWASLPHVLTQHGYDPNQNFLFSDKYQTTSILSFYGPDHKRAYFLNIHGIRNNQFSYWPSLQAERQNQTGYFVWIENTPHLERNWQTKRDFYQNALTRYFEKVEFLELAPLVYHGPNVAKGVLIFRCQNCHDIQPDSSFLY